MTSSTANGLQITEKPQWSFENPKGDYTKKYTLIGQDILHVEICAKQAVDLEHIGHNDLLRLIREEKLSGKPIYIMIDCTNISSLRYSCKKEFTDIIYSWSPDFRQIVIYNVDPSMRVQLEMLQSIAPNRLSIILAITREDAITKIMNFKSGNAPEAPPRDPSAEKELRLKEEFLATAARMAWLKMFDQQVYLPPENHITYPFFKAIEVIQSDFKDIELEHERVVERTLLACQKKLALKTTALDTQFELSKINARRQKAAEAPSIAGHSNLEIESSGISKVDDEKASTLKALFAIIAELEIDNRTKQQITNYCLHLAESDQKEHQHDRAHTAADTLFISVIQKKHPTLNQKELRICLLIKLDYNSRDISRFMGLSVRGVESMRYRLHKKIGIDRHRSLKTYLTNLELQAT
jgi:DNA-binding CsgD family transcriptional regulator